MTLPPMLAIMFPTIPGAPAVIDIWPLAPGVDLKTQAKQALTPWTESGDTIALSRTESGTLAVIVTDEGEDVDVFAVEVPEAKRREALFRWLLHQNVVTRDFWASFTEAEAASFWTLALEAHENR